MLTSLPVVAPEDVTPAWLSLALQRGGIAAEVSAFSATPVGAGQLAETVRFTLTYAAGSAADAPASVIGKFTCADATAAATARDLDLYRAEVMFYRAVAVRAGIRTPRMYGAELAADGASFVLLLEDLAPAPAGNHLEGCALADVYRALDEAALLHAATWNDAALAGQPWLYVPQAAEGFFTGEMMAEGWAWYSEQFGEQLEPEVRAACAAYVRYFDAWNAPRLRHRCYAHGDFRVDNMLFAPDRLCLVDWQTACYVGAGLDIGYFLGGALPRDLRRRHQDDLLRYYHERLCAAGVRDYSLAQCMDDYRHYTPAAASTVIVAARRVRRTPRGDRLFMQMASEAAWQALDNGLIEALPRL